MLISIICTYYLRNAVLCNYVLIPISHSIHFHSFNSVSHSFFLFFILFFSHFVFDLSAPFCRYINGQFVHILHLHTSIYKSFVLHHICARSIIAAYRQTEISSCVSYYSNARMPFALLYISNSKLIQLQIHKLQLIVKEFISPSIL